MASGPWARPRARLAGALVGVLLTFCHRSTAGQRLSLLRQPMEESRSQPARWRLAAYVDPAGCWRFAANLIDPLKSLPSIACLDPNRIPGGRRLRYGWGKRQRKAGARDQRFRACGRHPVLRRSAIAFLLYQAPRATYEKTAYLAARSGCNVRMSAHEVDRFDFRRWWRWRRIDDAHAA